MERRLQQYIDSFFVNAPHTIRVAEVREEILRNTLDRYNDLIAEGVSPEQAYRTAINGIGDINAILCDIGCEPISANGSVGGDTVSDKNRGKRAVFLAIGVAMCILSLVPVCILDKTRFGDTLGPALMFVFVAVGVGFILFQTKYSPRNAKAEETENESPLMKSISAACFTVGLAVYFIFSFTTGAWYISWLIFPITGCIVGIIKACFDLKKGE